jgi:hypothetical protein
MTRLDMHPEGPERGHWLLGLVIAVVVAVLVFILADLAGVP